MKKKFAIPIIIVILVITILVVPSAKYAVSNILIKISSGTMSSFQSTGNAIGDKFSFFNKIRTLSQRNNELADRLVQMEVDKNQIIELEKENSLLKNELGFVRENPDLKLLPARVIGRDPTSFLDYITIDKGEMDGIKKGMAVISGGVLIGQISSVYDKESKVTLITSKDSMVLVMLQGSRAKGVLRGGISGLLLENITQDIVFEAGENVITSGLEGELKPGILVGKTGLLESSTSDLFKNISVEPLADLSKLEMVFVIQ